jgi:integrase
MLLVPTPMAAEKELAKHLVLKNQQLLSSKHPDYDPDKIHSVRSANNFMNCIALYLAWRSENGLPAGERDNRNQALIYLEERSEVYKQSTLNQHRLALIKIFRFKLPPIKAESITFLRSRNYNDEQVNLITDHLDEHNALSTLIAFFTGMRAHEFITLRPLGESERSSHRTWRNDLFRGMPDHIIYTTKGKGGLVRYVAMPIPLAEQLELRRLPQPKDVVDRGVFGKIHYDIGFGQSLSQAFSIASAKCLGYSTGFHGLRHSFAKWRYRTLIQFLEWHDARLILSQELGHFRPEITSCYMQ